MREQFLHFIWQYQRFRQDDLQTDNGELIQVIQPGTLNPHDGPDFLHATIKIGNFLWTGSVEIHVDGKDWYHHQHHKDVNYSNVILHVVYRNAKSTLNIGGFDVPILELDGRIPLSLIHRFDQLLANNSLIACSNHIHDVDEFILLSWKERLIVERLQEKVGYFESIIEQQKGDWEGAFFQILTKNFGLLANTDGFDAVAKSIDYRILLKHRHSLFELEALLFGQAGMLDRSFKDNYPILLQKEYKYFKKKYKLSAIPVGYWKFKGLRPMAFPTIRIAQLAALLHQFTPVFSTFRESEHPISLLKQVLVSAYWETHYTFDHPSNHKIKHIGSDFANTLIINSFIPMLFAIGKATSVPDLCIQSLEFLRTLKPEINRKTNLWKMLGIEIENAADSQAMIQMLNQYCIPKKCLSCPIGCQILKGEDYLPPIKLAESLVCYY